MLLQAADRCVEGVRLRGFLARALYNWGLRHARDRARYSKLVVLVGVRSDIIARLGCREHSLPVGRVPVGILVEQCLHERGVGRSAQEIHGMSGVYCISGGRWGTRGEDRNW